MAATGRYVPGGRGGRRTYQAELCSAAVGGRRRPQTIDGVVW